MLIIKNATVKCRSEVTPYTIIGSISTCIFLTFLHAENNNIKVNNLQIIRGNRISYKDHVKKSNFIHATLKITAT